MNLVKFYPAGLCMMENNSKSEDSLQLHHHTFHFWLVLLLVGVFCSSHQSRFMPNCSVLTLELYSVFDAGILSYK